MTDNKEDAKSEVEQVFNVDEGDGNMLNAMLDGPME